MVLATGKPRHSASIAERRIVQEQPRLNSAAVPTVRKVQKNRSKPSDGTKKTADVVTKLRARTIRTSLRGTSGGGYENNWKVSLNTQDRITLTTSERSATLHKKMFKKPTPQFLPANKFANVQCRKTRGDGIRGLHRLLLRRIGEGHLHGGLPQNGENIIDLSKNFAWRQ